MKKNIIKSIKGFKDILPDEAKFYRYFEDISSKVSEQFSIEELRFSDFHGKSLENNLKH